MDSIITYLLSYNQYLINIIGELLLFISQHIPLKQMIFDDSNSPEYQKFKVDKLPTILKFEKVDYKLLLAYYKHKYNKTVKPVQRRNGKSIPKKLSVLNVVHLMNIFMIITVIKVNINARFVIFHLKKLIMQLSQLFLFALTVVLRLRSKSNVNILEYINAIIPNAHIIRRILRNFLKILILLININTSFTIYTVNSILTSLRWIYIQYQNMLQDLLLKSLILI